MDSYVRNCHVTPKNSDETLFTEHPDGTVTASLDGYAVIPLAEYERLLSLLSEVRDGVRLEFVTHRDYVDGPYLHWVYICDEYGDMNMLGRGDTPDAARAEAERTLAALMAELRRGVIS